MHRALGKTINTMNPFSKKKSEDLDYINEQTIRFIEQIFLICGEYARAFICDVADTNEQISIWCPLQRRRKLVQRFKMHTTEHVFIFFVVLNQLAYSPETKKRINWWRAAAKILCCKCYFRYEALTAKWSKNKIIYTNYLFSFDMLMTHHGLGQFGFW